MKAIVVGAGFTGIQLARALVARGADVAIVESDSEKALAARERVDCSVIEAAGNDPEILASAGVADADAIIALTENDEVNLVTCALAEAAHQGIRAVARVRNHCYVVGEYGAKSPFGNARMVNPDAEAAAAICFAAEHGAVGNVIVLDGGYGIVELVIAPESPLAGAPLKEFPTRAGRRCLVAYAETSDGSFIPDGSTVLSAGDTIGVVAQPEDIDPLLAVAGSPTGEPLRRIAIFGAGRIGTLVTERFLADNARTGGFFTRRASRKREIVLVDSDAERCREASRRFPEVRVICGDITESDLLAEEGLDAGDLAVAATGDYERNLVMAAYLKSRGARRTIALTASAEFDDIARKLGVDVTVPLRDVVVDAISGHLRGTAVRAVHSVCDRLFEIIECDILAGSRAAGKTLRQIAAPGEYLVLLSAGAGQSALAIPGGETILATGGRAVLVARAGGRRAERMLAARD